MRALPIIVDLFVLLTVFAVILFYAALGNSAPNEETRGAALFELTARLVGPQGTEPAFPHMRLEGILLTSEDAAAPGDVVALPSGPSVLRLLVRSASPGANLHVVIVDIDEEAFAYDDLFMTLRRIYSSPGTEEMSSPVGQTETLSIVVGNL